MSLGGRTRLAGLAALAIAVGCVDAIGWWWWESVVRTTRLEPTAAALRIASDPLLALPSVVHRSRRAPSRELVGSSRTALTPALARLARLQRTWLPGYPEGFRNAARAALLLDDPGAAFTEIERALARDPTSPRLHLFAAVVLRASGRYDAFLEHLAEALALAPQLDTAVADLTVEDGRWIGIEALRLRLDRYPRQRISTTIEIARELRRRGRHEEGLALLTGLAARPEVAIEIARWEVDAGRPADAIARLETIARRAAYPASLRVRAWATLAEARDLAGDPGGALEAAREALRLDPSSAAPYLALATLAEREGHDLQALDHLRRAWGVAPADVQLLLRIAAVAERTGYLADARLALQRAVEVRPDDPELAARLVEFYLRNGEYMDAALGLSRALDRFPTHQRLLGLTERLRREVTSR